MENTNLLNELNDSEIDSLMQYTIPYSEENRINIKNKFVRKAALKRKKSAFLKFAVSASAVLIASTLVYAQVIDFSRIYKIVFGDKSEYVEKYIEPFVSNNNVTAPVNNEPQPTETPIEPQTTQTITAPQAYQAVIESEYDGIIFKLISAVNDGDALRIFATMQDTTGDRLSGSMDFNSWGLSQGHGGNADVIDYDRESKTATILITSLGGDHEGEATLSVNGITSGRQIIEGLKESKINAYEILQNYTPQTMSQDSVWGHGTASQSPELKKLAQSSDLLKRDEQNITFNNIDWSYISNIGFVDGHLHIQTSKMSDSKNELMSINFINSENEIVDHGHLTIYYTDTDKRYYDPDELPYAHYKEMIYEKITGIEQLNGLDMVIDIMEQGNDIEGSWEFSFEIPKKITTEFVINKEFIINEKLIKIDSISLSPLGITINLPDNIASDYKHTDAAYITYDDGTVIELNETSISGYQDISTLKFGGNIIEIEKVKNIVLNNEVIYIK